MNRQRSERSLIRALGVWGLAASIINVTVGGGIFRLPAAGAAALGPAAPVAYIVCAVAMGLIVLCFAEAGSRVSLTGGLYAYVEVAFGPLVGFLAGVFLWVGITAAAAAVAAFFADALGALVPAFASPVVRSTTLIVALAGLSAINIAGVQPASRLNAVLTVAKLLPLLVLIVVGIGSVNVSNLAWSATPAVSSVARASAVLIFAFFGVETALVPSGEVRDPARTVPRAIFIAMLGAVVLYLTLQIVAQGVLGASLAEQKTPLAEAAAVVLGDSGRTFILVGSIISMFGYVCGATLAAPRMLFAFGRDGFLPVGLASVHSRFHTPHIAIAIQAVIVIGLAVTGSFETLVIVANGSVLLVYAACCLGVLELRRKKVQGAGTPFRVPFAAVIPLVATMAIVWLLTSLTMGEWSALLIVIVIALVAYAISLPSRRAALPLGDTSA